MNSKNCTKNKYRCLDDTPTIYEYLSIIPEMSNCHAIKYLRYGFVMRALQLKECNFQLLQTLEKAGGENLDLHYSCNLNIFLNSFYLNIFGALDNLAWALNHEFELIKGANENNKLRNLISLFCKEYQKALLQKDDTVVKDINKHKNWFTEIKEFRHPAAHRIPLYYPHGIVLEKHQEEYKKHLEFLNLQTDVESYSDALRKLRMVGAFEPFFMNINVTDDKTYHIGRTLKIDYAPFWELANIILKFIKGNLKNKKK